MLNAVLAEAAEAATWRWSLRVGKRDSLAGSAAACHASERVRAVRPAPSTTHASVLFALATHTPLLRC